MASPSHRVYDIGGPAILASWLQAIEITLMMMHDKAVCMTEQWGGD